MFNKSSEIALIVVAISGFLGSISALGGFIAVLLKLIGALSISWTLALAPIGLGVVFAIIGILAQATFLTSFFNHKF